MSYQYVYTPVTFRIEYKAPGGNWTFLKRETVASSGGSASTALSYFAPVGVLGDWSIRAVLESGGSIGIANGLASRHTATDPIAGKTTSRYKRAYYFPLPAPGPWDVRVTRVTADSTSSALRNETWFDSLAEIVESKLSYPNSAIVGASIDAEQFSNIPTRAYEIYGMLCQIPSNYDPVARTYDGIWDGTFVLACTDNPAWVYYDILSGSRYGLGEYIDVLGIDKWALYEIAQHCDGLVPSGYGYMEPRFTCNLYIQTREDAYKVLINLASVFRGMAYWSAGQVTAVSDMPSDAVAIFTNANVVDGVFTYAGSSRSVRHTVALVTWNDPADMYRQKVEYVEDADGIIKYGVNETEVVAFGCTSRGQAHRMGKWILYTERLETEGLSFKTGLEGVSVYPGAVIKVADSLRSGDRIGGRILAAGPAEVTLDSEVTLLDGLTYTLSVVLPDGTIEDKVVTTPASTTATLAVATGFAETPQVHSMWVMASANLVPQTFRVLSVTEAGKSQVEVSCLQHDPNKYAMVELNETFQSQPISSINGSAPTAPLNLAGSDTLFLQGPGLVGIKSHFSWANNGVRYEVKWKQAEDNFKVVTVSTNYADIAPVVEGPMTVMVKAIDSLGRPSPWATLDYTVLGKTAPPADVPWFTINGETLTWGVVGDIDLDGYRIRYQTGNSRSWGDAEPMHEGLVVGNTYVMSVRPTGAVTLLIKAVDTSGNESRDVAAIVADLGDPLVANVIVTHDFHALGFPGEILGGTIEGGTGDLVAAQDATPLMWSNDLAGMWAVDDTTPMWTAFTYGTMSYIGSYAVAPGDAGAQLTLPRSVVAGVVSVSYRRSGLAPMWSSDSALMWDADDTTLMWDVEAWRPWPGFVTSEALTYEWEITTSAGATQGRIASMEAQLDVPDIVEHFDNLSVAAIGTRLPITKTYRQITNVSITLQSDGGVARTAIVMDKSSTLGPLVQTLNAAYSGTTGSIDATIQGH